MKSAGKTVNGTIMAQFDDEYVVLLEQSIASNKHVVEENRRLRDELKTKEEQNSKVLSEVLKELQQLKEKHGGKERGRARGKRSTAIKVPSSCRVSSLNGNILAHLFRLLDLAYHFSFYANAIFVICLPLLVKQNISM